MKWIKWVAIIVLVVVMLVAINRWRQVETKPIFAEVNVGEVMLAVTEGTYCWQSAGRGECVDKIAPHAMDLGTPTIVEAGAVVTISYAQQPSTHELQIWRGAYNYETLTTDFTFAAPSEPGTYIYNAFARWEGQGDTSSAFQLQVR